METVMLRKGPNCWTAQVMGGAGYHEPMGELIELPFAIGASASVVMRHVQAAPWKPRGASVTVSILDMMPSRATAREVLS